MKVKRIIWLLVFPLIFANCDDEATEDLVGCMDELASNYNEEAVQEGDCSFDPAVVLVSSQWIIESATAEFSGTTINLLDLTEAIPVCTHDNLFLFSDSNEVTMEDNLVLCEDGEESVLDLSGSWHIEEDVLTIENGVEVYVLSIYNLTNTSMDLRFDYNLDLNGTLFPIPANIRFISNPL